MNNKLFNFIQTLYLYFQVSFYFWIHVIKGLLIYSLIPATAALFLSIKAIREQKDDEGVKSLYKTYYRKYEEYKLPSFFYSLLFSILLASLFFISKWESKPAFMLILVIIIIYLLILSIVLFSYSVYFITTRPFTFKQAMVYSFVSAIKNIIQTIGVLIIVAGLIYTAYLNFAFFVIFSPFLYGLGMTFLFSKLKKG
jgi:uncharacterized membrane protein YesL